VPVGRLFVVAHRDHAPVGHFADHVLKLDRCVVDVKLGVKTFFYVPQDALAD
jgi:hypothetical protein